jgi:hypothetical protein
MAKPLHEPLPSSSIARLLDHEAASRATAPPLATPLTPHAATASARAGTAPAVRAGEASVCIKREFTLCPLTDEAFNQLVGIYRRATRTRLSNSHVMRALLRGIAHCMDGLENEAIQQLIPQKLPSNARGKDAERDRFEERLASAVIAGVRAVSGNNEKE